MVEPFAELTLSTSPEMLAGAEPSDRKLPQAILNPSFFRWMTTLRSPKNAGLPGVVERKSSKHVKEYEPMPAVASKCKAPCLPLRSPS